MWFSTVLLFWESGVSFRERWVNKCEQLLLSHLLSQTVSRSQAFGQTWVLWCWVRVRLPEIQRHFKWYPQVMAPLIIIINQYADFAYVLYFLFYVFLSSLQPECHPPLLLSQCFLNLAAHSHLQPCLSVPQTYIVYLLCVHVQASVCHILYAYMVWCVHLYICKWDSWLATVRNSVLYSLLLSWLPALASWAGSKVPSKQKRCPFPWVSS